MSAGRGARWVPIPLAVLGALVAAAWAVGAFDAAAPDALASLGAPAELSNDSANPEFSEREQRSAPESIASGDEQTAALELELTERGLPTAATLSVLSGANAGRCASVDAQGTLLLEALSPGRVIVEIVTASGVGCRRELQLRPRQAERLALDFGDYGFVEGFVRDQDGQPVQGAHVVLDDESGLSDASGRFVLARSVSDAPVVTVCHPGYATQRSAPARVDGQAERRPLELRLIPTDASASAASGSAELDAADSACALSVVRATARVRCSPTRDG